MTCGKQPSKLYSTFLPHFDYCVFGENYKYYVDNAYYQVKWIFSIENDGSNTEFIELDETHNKK